MHISQSTKDSLHGEFRLEPGNGGERCEYLLEKGIETYLVVVPKETRTELSRTVSVLFILLFVSSETCNCHTPVSRLLAPSETRDILQQKVQPADLHNGNKQEHSLCAKHVP